jgi:hypothetical protein
MKTASIPAPLNPTILLIGLLFAAVVFVAVSGRRVPLISSPRAAMIALLALGMAMCTVSGINRVAALGQWGHPLAILGYLIGAAILLVGAATIFGWKLPFVRNDLQAIVIVASLTAAKIVLTVIHSLLPRG